MGIGNEMKHTTIFNLSIRFTELLIINFFLIFYFLPESENAKKRKEILSNTKEFVLMKTTIINL